MKLLTRFSGQDIEILNRECIVDYRRLYGAEKTALRALSREP